MEPSWAPWTKRSQRQVQPVSFERRRRRRSEEEVKKWSADDLLVADPGSSSGEPAGSIDNQQQQQQQQKVTLKGAVKDPKGSQYMHKIVCLFFVFESLVACCDSLSLGCCVHCRQSSHTHKNSIITLQPLETLLLRRR
jgi:hypothetical protein